MQTQKRAATDTSEVPAQDWHVHSRWSDGKGTVDENIRAAEARGLSLLGCVDHVRMDTDYLPGFVADIQRARETTEVILLCGVEAKLLDTSGGVDVPPLPPGVNLLLLADHQVPTALGPVSPKVIKASIEAGELSASRVAADLITATCRALEVWAKADIQVVLAHWGSVLPKCGIPEEALRPDELDRLARLCAETGTCVEVSERWVCPPLAFLKACRSASVRILPSTDSHVPGNIGMYDHVYRTFRLLGIA